MTALTGGGPSHDFGEPRWNIQPTDGTSPRTVKGILTGRGAVRWYTGSALSMIWLLTFIPILTADGPVRAIVPLTLLAVFAVGFLVGAPLAWAPRATRHRLLPAAALFVFSFSLFPWAGWEVRGLWTYVGVLVGMAVLPLRLTWLLLFALGAASLLAGVALNGWNEDILWIPAILISISAMMAAFARNIAAMNELRATRDQMATMAVERERSRVARDLHDILGHSLTVITVKTELAGRLIDVDPERARTEIAEVEQLARGALTDVRATVAGYRGVSISGELAAARAALEAAGIEAQLPGSTDMLPADRRELAGWVVREGVTNVIRHAQASRCRIELTARAVAICDDGVGPRADEAVGGNGLVGIRERVESAGGRLTIGRSDLGGFLLKATL
ncbi:sensor histidine kinase [Microbacterium laevaniformans]|uniref:sensor histidine kinase n=1 Tax=Microbacterium TaxID=33882 RepID=UPI00044FF636|nr:MULTISPECIES: sensor histidine kinase [Microbacterium]EXJ51416.1 histidine kinase [Microbacterium sp. MRS-1]MBM7754118.1 two-component system sensor histidine kinase DesK [Microbacterium laevaniformans]GLJ65866.1 histidine kinase [Microbacterium laevaniformans]